VYQQYFDATYTKAGSFYAAKLVPSAQADYFIYPKGFASQQYWYERFKGKTVTWGCLVLSSTASDFRLNIWDGVTANYSSYHTGGGSWEWLEVTLTVNAANTTFHVATQNASATPGIAYISQPMLTFGSSIGAGNYVPEADRFMAFEKAIDSQAFHAKTGTSGFSDTATTALVLTSDSGGLIGKGCRIARARSTCNDVGSAATNVYFVASGTISNNCSEYYNSPYGRVNDTSNTIVNDIFCNSTGDYQYVIEASAGSTFDITVFRYVGCEWR